MHPHRSSALGYASAASALHSRVYGACSAEAAASQSSGLSVGGCIRASRYFWAAPRTVTVIRPLNQRARHLKSAIFLGRLGRGELYF